MTIRVPGLIGVIRAMLSGDWEKFERALADDALDARPLRLAEAPSPAADGAREEK